MRYALDLPPGINSDETSFTTPVWNAGSNVRPYRGRMQPIGGCTKVIATALTGTCRNLISWVDNSGISIKAFGTTEALQVLFDDTLYDVTPSGLADGNVDAVEAGGFGTGGFGTGGFGGGFVEYYPRTWSLATYGESLLASPKGNGLYNWTNDTGTAAAVVSNAPATIISMIVTPQRIVMVGGCEEEVSGDFNWLALRWCDPEDITDWTTSATNNAGEYILESGGKIVALANFGARIAIWTESSLYIATYIGDPAQTFDFELVGENCGLAGPNAFTIKNQTAYWLTPDLQFKVYTIGGEPTAIPCSVSKEFRDKIDTDQIAKVACTGVSEFNEIWWHYPDSRDGTENSRYVALALSEGPSWFPGIMARTAAIDSGPQRYAIMVDDSGYIYYHENGTDAAGSDLQAYLAAGGQYLGDGEVRVFLGGIWPDIKDQTETITLTILGQDWPQSTVESYGPFPLAPGLEKEDFAIDTRIFAPKFTWTTIGAGGRIGKPAFDLVESGRS